MNTNFRNYQFFRPSDLSIYRATSPDLLGDDGRASLPLSEVLLVSLLTNRSAVATRDVYGSGLIACVTNARQPVVATVWDGRVWIVDGRQRAGDESQRGSPSAIQEINRRSKQICDLALELVRENPALADRPEELRIKTRNEAINRRNQPVWAWANSAMLPLFIGGRIDPSSDLQADALVEFYPFNNADGMLTGGPTFIEYVSWVVFEPEDRNPISFVTQLGSLSLKAAQVATPPTEEAKQFRSLTAPKAPPRLANESDAEYSARVGNGPFGSGVPISYVAAMVGVDKNTVMAALRLLTLEPEVQAALDAHVRGEDGLSKRQVQEGGFFIKAPTGEKIPKSREEQLKLLDELRGKRGFAKATSEDESTDATPSRGSGSSGGSGDVATRREVSVTDSALDRHSANEPRAKVGPDSPATAGELPKVTKLDPVLFLAVSERIDCDLQELTPLASGLLPSGKEQTAEDVLVYRLVDMSYQITRYLAGDPTAFDGSTSPSVQRAVAMVKDAFKEVFASRGVAIRAGIGAVSTGAHVLPVADRTPAEVIVTPRAGETVNTTLIEYATGKYASRSDVEAATAKAVLDVLPEITKQVVSASEAGVLTSEVPVVTDPVSTEPYWRDNAPVTWPEGFKNGKPITAEAAILVGEPSPEVAPVPTVKAAPKAKPAATAKSTKPSASKVKKPKTKSKRVSRPKAAK